MATQSRSSAEGEFQKKNQAKVEPSPISEQSEEIVDPSKVPGELSAAAGGGNIQGQATHLSDPRLQTVQRQALAAQIGRIQGNRHLHRVVSSIPKKKIQRHPISAQEEELANKDKDEGTTVEEEEHPLPVQAKRISTARPAIQRQDTAAGSATPPSSTTSAPVGLIVDDAEENLQPGQMNKSVFLSQVRTAVGEVIDQEVGGTPFLSVARTQFEQQFAGYTGLNGQTLEQTIQREIPGAGGIKDANAYIPLICEKVRQTIAEKIPKDGVTNILAEGMGVLNDVAQGIGNAISSIGSIFFKAREGGPKAVGNPHTLHSGLGSGQALGSGVRSKFETAYGQDFSGVRVHTDATAAQLSNNLNARAFTIGQDIAFGAGEYQPGSIVGDALIAHELAHVVQQGNVASQGAVLPKSQGEQTSALEEDADISAVQAVVSLWSGAKTGLTTIAQDALPQLRTGLRLQRCVTAAKDKRVEEMETMLKSSATGQDAINVVSKHNVNVAFGSSGGGSVFSSGTNTMTLDPGQTTPTLAMVYVHEANHARYFHERKTANTSEQIQKLSREDYVKKMLDEEVESAVLQIEAKVELEGASVDVSGASVPLEREYRAAHKKAVDAEKAKKPDATEEELKRIGRQAGRQAVLDGFKTGRVVTSNTKETYPIYYGKAWDKAHASK